MIPWKQVLCVFPFQKAKPGVDFVKVRSLDQFLATHPDPKVKKPAWNLEHTQASTV